ncbi:MAG TPA: hypothetical protein VMM93_08550 [Vicinamibacterales bacterium]|nr:hypothetical protein [Vicinamibacterales bacterium]
MRTRPRELALVIAAACLATVVFTWPLVGRFGSAGRIDSGDGRFSVWNVAWVAHALTTNPGRLWDANIFYPHPQALAYSEANLFAGALAVPVWRLTANPHAASNWTILCSFILTFIVTYLLARRLTGSRLGASVAAFEFAFCPFVFAHIPHVQLLMTFGLALVLLAMHAYIERACWSRAIGLGVAMAVAGLACGYYGVFGGLMAGLGVLWFSAWEGRWRQPRYWLLALAGAGLAFLIVLPFLLPFIEIRRQGFERSLEDARLFSVAWRSYFASAQLMDRWMLDLIGRWVDALFPGFLASLLMLVALVVTFRRGAAPAERTTRPVVGFYAALAVLAVWASQGPKGGLYTVLYETVPFFALLRAPARFGVVVMLAFAVLGAFGAAALLRRVERRRLPLVAGLLGLALAGSTAGPLPLVDVPPVNPVYRQLAGLPRAPLIEFPFFADRGEIHRHTLYMLNSTYHWQPLVNGYSDHTPHDAWEAQPILSTFPSREAWQILSDLRVRYVVVHWSLLLDDGPVVRTGVETDPRLRLMVETPEASLYEVVDWSVR